MIEEIYGSCALCRQDIVPRWPQCGARHHTFFHASDRIKKLDWHESTIRTGQNLSEARKCFRVAVASSRRSPESQWFVMARVQGCCAEIEETTPGLLSRFAGRTRAEIRHNSFDSATLHRFGLLLAALLLACNVLAAQEQTSPGKQSSLLISGRVLAETGQPSPDPVSLSLFCEGRPFKAVHTGTQWLASRLRLRQCSDDADADSSASDTVSPASGSFSFQGISRGFHADGGANVSLTGCELRVSAVNYQPITHTLSGPVDFGRLDVGTLQLTRLVHVNGSVVDVNSLLVPESARKGIR